MTTRELEEQRRFEEVNKKLRAAFHTPEADVKEPPRRRSSSFAAQVTDLEVGESASRVVPIDPTYTIKKLSEALPVLRENLRNNTAPAVRQASTRTGGKYTTELADITTTGDRFYIVAIVTRTA